MYLLPLFFGAELVLVRRRWGLRRHVQVSLLLEHALPGCD